MLAALGVQQACALISADLGPNRATVTTDQGGGLYTGDLKDPGNTSAQDQIGIWENSGPANVWNYTGYTGASGLYDADGVQTTVSIAVTQHSASASNWGVDDLLSDGPYANPGTSILWSITGLVPDQQYALVVYHSNQHPATQVTVNGYAPTTYTGPMSPASYTEETQFWYFEVAADGEGKLNGVSGFAPEDSTHNTFTGFQLDEIGVLPATTTELVSSANPSVEGQGVTFTATVKESGVTAADATGTITFSIDNTAVAVEPVVAGQATFTTSELAAGDRAVSAEYSGDSAYAGSTGNLVQSVSVSPYNAWAGPDGFNLSGGPGDDDDGDGLSNFQEFAFGLDPTSGASVNPVTDTSDLATLGQFSYTRLANSGLTYTVWVSTDLLDWGTEPATITDEPGAPDEESGVQTVLVELNDPPSGGRVFVRVKAE
jgi:hypothetical protein